MAKLQKIFISGIRSYGTGKDDAQTLSFYSPVTLLLGQNGCGKTTVIECIKHALTGDFPTSGKSGGQTFVADPTLYEKSCVQGCIKLAFQDIYGRPATISRTLRVDVVNAASSQMRYKSQDASYMYYDRNGTQHTRSAKLQDCKDLIKILIGVSESILNNVLLCHQEDSLWPLAEDSQVKKKFDQIFDASKYERAVDQMSRSIKKHVENLKNKKKDLIHLMEIRSTAQDKRDLLKEKTDSFSALTNRRDDFKTRTVPMRQRLDEVIALEENIHLLKNLQSNYNNELISNQGYQKDLKELLKSTFEGTDEEMEHEIENFHVGVKRKQAELEQVNKSIAQLSLSLNSNNREEQQKRAALAALQEQIRLFRSRIQERDDNATLLMSKYNTKPAGSFQANFEEIQSSFEAEQKRLMKTETEFKEVERKAEEEVETTNMKYMEVKNKANLKQQEKENAMIDKRNIESQLEDLSASDVEFKNIEAKITRVDLEISQIQSTFNEDSAIRSIESNKKRVRELNETLEDLDRDMKDFMHNAMIEKEIEHHQSDKMNKEKEIRNLKNKHHKHFQHVFDKDIPTKNFRAEVKKVRQRESILCESQLKERNEKEKLSSTLNAKLCVLKNEFDGMRREYQNGQQAIEKFCKIEEFENKRTTIEEENRRLQKEKGQLSAFKIIYKEFVKDLSEKKCCPVCETDFTTKQATVTKLANAMNGKIQNIPARLSSVTTQLESGEKLHNELTKLSPIHLKMTKLENDLKLKDNSVKAMDSEYVKVRKELVELKANIEEHQKTVDLCSQLGPSATMIDQYTDDIAKSALKIAALQEKCIEIRSNRSEADTVTLKHETKEEISRLSDENERTSKRISTNQTRLHNCRTQKAELIGAQLKWQRMVQDTPQLIIKQQELDEKLEEIENMLEAAENDSLNALTDMEEAKHRFTTIKSENAKAIEILRQECQQHKSDIKDIEKLTKEIKQFEDKNVENKCNDVAAEINQLKDQRSAMEQEGHEFKKQLEILKDELRDQDSNQKSLLNNKKIRQLAQTEVNLKKKIEGIAMEIENKNYHTIQQEKVSLQRELGNMITDTANMDGQIKALRDNIADINKELASFKTDPEQAVIMKLFEVNFEELAIVDLRRVHDSVSLAICKYHRQQLLSINHELRELWRKIYQGNDIDYIQIESGETVLGNSRRQYSYCIMQIKNGVKMPLRAKCSAGQKVLSCLLVRLALALHFSSNCGIFALDEPTTNLDRANIKSLSEAIAKLVSRRHKDEGNFQFLIITHDEEFLDALRQEDTIREYYRITRNDRGNSIVTQKLI